MSKTSVYRNSSQTGCTSHVPGKALPLHCAYSLPIEWFGIFGLRDRIWTNQHRIANLERYQVVFLLREGGGRDCCLLGVCLTLPKFHQLSWDHNQGTLTLNYYCLSFHHSNMCTNRFPASRPRTWEVVVRVVAQSGNVNPIFSQRENKSIFIIQVL